MNNKRFFQGLIAGVVVVLLANTFYTTFINKTANESDMKLRLIDKYLKDYYMGDLDYDEMYKEMDEYKYYGYVRALGDPYTTYMDKDTFKKYTESTEGRFAGIGVSVTTDKTDGLVTVKVSYNNAPAQKAGVKAGDKIIAVDGEDVYGKDIQEVIGRIKGDIGTIVNITFLRESESSSYSVDITRDEIEVPTVIDKYFDNGIGYIMITDFDRVTLDQFKTSYYGLRDEGIKGLVIDVRNNPGGLLSVVTSIADILMPEGLITYVEDKNGKRDVYESDAEHIDIPLVILVNENSASASEVLAGAIKDSKTGVLVGNTTFGKGVVQNLLPLVDDTALKITIAKYYTPSGVCIHGIGLEPDYEVSLNKDLILKIQDLTLEEDTQLQKAIEVVTEKIVKN